MSGEPIWRKHYIKLMQDLAQFEMPVMVSMLTDSQVECIINTCKNIQDEVIEYFQNMNYYKWHEYPKNPPTESGGYIVYNVISLTPYGMANYDVKKDKWFTCDGLEIYPPTHWSEMPDKPKKIKYEDSRTGWNE